MTACHLPTYPSPPTVLRYHLRQLRLLSSLLSTWLQGSIALPITRLLSYQGLRRFYTPSPYSHVAQRCSAPLSYSSKSSFYCQSRLPSGSFSAAMSLAAVAHHLAASIPRSEPRYPPSTTHSPSSSLAALLPSSAAPYSLPTAVVVHAILPFLSLSELMDVRQINRSFRAFVEPVAIARTHRQLALRTQPSSENAAADEGGSSSSAGTSGPASVILNLSLADVAWLRHRLDWLSTQRCNAMRAERGEGGGDFELLSDFKDSWLFGLEYRDFGRGQAWEWDPCWLYPAQTFASILRRALQQTGSGGMDALRREWQLRQQQQRELREESRASRERTRVTLKAALQAVDVDLDALRTNDDAHWDDGDCSWGGASWWPAEGPMQAVWICRARRPVSERFVKVHEALVGLGMAKETCTCAADGSGCCLR